MSERKNSKEADLSLTLVLFVDDDDDDRLLFELALQSHLPAIEVRTFAREALLFDFLVQYLLMPDLILLDLYMSGLNGVKSASSYSKPLIIKRYPL